ncbi:MAG: tetratricopeptide repeat protein, partial [Phycisphaeraceae bacterium]
MSHPSVLSRFHAPRGSNWIHLFAVLAALGVMTGCHAGFHTGYAAYEREKYDKAAEKLEPLAERGHARSQFLLGLMHDRGHGVERDLERAAHWYEQAATQGFAPAQTNLGVLLQTGAVDEPAPERAAGWYEQAAAQGHAAARHNLAMLLLTGRGMEVDRDRAR